MFIFCSHRCKFSVGFYGSSSVRCTAPDTSLALQPPGQTFRRDSGSSGLRTRKRAPRSGRGAPAPWQRYVSPPPLPVCPKAFRILTTASGAQTRPLVPLNPALSSPSRQPQLKDTPKPLPTSFCNPHLLLPREWLVQTQTSWNLEQPNLFCQPSLGPHSRWCMKRKRFRSLLDQWLLPGQNRIIDSRLCGEEGRKRKRLLTAGKIDD